MQWFDASTLINLQTLNLAFNEIGDITQSGLAKCSQLSVLNLANNRITSEDNIHYLALLPALLNLDLRDNPVTAVVGSGYVACYCRGSRPLPPVKVVHGQVEDAVLDGSAAWTPC
jgi:Leucine-rich repeat (LRR) protein